MIDTLPQRRILTMSNVPQFASFDLAIQDAKQRFPDTPIPTHRWQGIDVPQRPEMQMHEVEYFSFLVDLCGIESLEVFRDVVRPNTPWADNHFEERVCGFPINPGHEWQNWPNADSAAEFLNHRGQFNHNYMERYWPQYAGIIGACSTPEEYEKQAQGDMIDMHLFEVHRPHRGIYHDYGDLAGVVRVLHRDPLTRQAILPVWFPEDTGDSHSDRKPCSISYHFMCRGNRLDMVYYIRSCDFVRHFRDDIYLTIRLQLWMLEQLRKKDNNWNEVRLGKFVMHIDSLHMFRNDYLAMVHQA